MARLGNEIWATAVEQANAQLATEREAMARTLKAREAERDEAFGIADKHAAMAENLEERLAGLEVSIEKDRSEIVNLRQSLAREEDRAQSSKEQGEALKVELQKAHEQIEALKVELQKANESKEKVREELAHLTGQLEMSNRLWNHLGKPSSTTSG